MSRLCLALLPLLIVVPSCADPGGTSGLPGESIGQYSVTATLSETSCGAGHPAPAEFSFFVEVRHIADSSVGFWKLPDGPAMEGMVQPESGFTFESSDQFVGVPADPEMGVVGCMVERAERVEGELLNADTLADAGPPQDGELGGFVGTTTVEVNVIPGSDCTPLLLPYGGAFPALPCSLVYELAAEELAEPLF